MMDKYILKKGNVIGKIGLPNGKLEAKNEDLVIDPKHVEVLKKNMHHFIESKQVVVEKQKTKEEKKADKKTEKETKKADKQIKK